MTDHNAALPARLALRELLNAQMDADLVPLYDGGQKVDVVWSRRKGREGEVMRLAEAERNLDKAIRAVWKILGQPRIKGDPVEFLYDE
jgi:hypothetical protein